MCQELTVLRWMGYSTESIWIRRFKLSASIPKTNSQTCWRKAISHMTNGTFCCICSTSWVTPHSLAAISFKQEASCDVQMPTGILFEWFTHSESEIQTDESCVSSVLVNETELRKYELKWGHREIQSILNILNGAFAPPASEFRKQVGLVFLVRVVKVKWVQNILEGSLTRQQWETACMWHKRKNKHVLNFKIRRSRTASTCKRFSEMRQTHYEIMKVSPKWRWKPTKPIRCGHCSWLRLWEQHYSCTRVTQRTWKYSRILSLKMLKACSIWQERWLGESSECDFIGSFSPTWERSTLLNDQVMQWARARV